MDYGAYVKLDEFQGREGLIHISEISTTWVRNVRDHVREGQKLVLKVLRVNPQLAQVDLSLRRVTGREKAEKMLSWKKEKKADSILKSAAEKLGVNPATTTQIAQAILEKYDTVYDALEESVENGEETFSKTGIDPEWARALTEVSRGKIRIEKALVRGTLELTCMGPNGVETIRSALARATMTRKPRGTEIRTYAVGAPKYRIEVVAGDYANAETTLKKAVEETLNYLKKGGGEGRLTS